MGNQRGITVSSSIGTIPEEVINDRLNKTLVFTQAQAGGRKGASPTDHVFILRNIMALAKKEGKHLLVSFFDVKKAFDRADMNDMLFILHKNGFRGKIWRLTKSLNEGLTARVKTKAGLTREIKREKGGKQGGKLMVPMFSKTMDTLAEDMAEDGRLGIDMNGAQQQQTQNQQNLMAALIFMDDVMSFAEGVHQQNLTLQAINEFGKKHQIEWGSDKCKVMETGTHKESQKEWALGEQQIKNCSTYKYLGEIISRDGKNEENLKERFKKVKATVRAINTCGKSNIMKKIEMKTLITLHDAVTLPTLLYNSETWPLNITTKKEIDKMEIWAWKSMLGLPKTTPTAAVMYCTGAMYASVRIEAKQLIYLQKILQKPEGHWTKQTLYSTKEKDTGWAKQVEALLETWQLEKDWEAIKRKSIKTWKIEVSKAAEVTNLKRLRNECYSRSRGEEKIKTKTRRIIAQLDNPLYKRKPEAFMNENKLIAKVYVMGRYGMLKCASNFSAGYGGKDCGHCGGIDNEDHRINYCELYRDINQCDRADKVDFEKLYSESNYESMPVVGKILELWDLGNGRNCMRTA